jgi:hypothetical protein
VVGVAKDARYLSLNLDKPVGASFFLPEAHAEYARANQGSLFLHDIVIFTRPGANLPIARYDELWLQWIPTCRSFRFAL